MCVSVYSESISLNGRYKTGSCAFTVVRRDLIIVAVVTLALAPGHFFHKLVLLVIILLFVLA